MSARHERLPGERAPIGPRPILTVHFQVTPAVQGRAVWATEAEHARIEFVGRAEDLIVAGVATEELLGRGRPGLRRRDKDGDPARVTRGKGWICLHVKKPLEHVFSIPGLGIGPLLEQFRRRSRTAP